MSRIEEPIHNLADLKKQQRILQGHVLEKEMELQQSFERLKAGLSMKTIIGKTLKLGFLGVKDMVTGQEKPAIPGSKTSMIGDLLRIGVYQISTMAAQGLSRKILGIFSRKQK